MSNVIFMSIDVYFVNVFGPAVLDVREGWDGSAYIETNLLECCGPDRYIRIAADRMSVVVDDTAHRLNCPAGT